MPAGAGEGSSSRTCVVTVGIVAPGTAKSTEANSLTLRQTKDALAEALRQLVEELGNCGMPFTEISTLLLGSGLSGGSVNVITSDGGACAATDAAQMKTATTAVATEAALLIMSFSSTSPTVFSTPTDEAERPHILAHGGGRSIDDAKGSSC